jgi:hypothetical protein
MSPARFAIKIPDDALEDLRRPLARTRLELTCEASVDDERGDVRFRSNGRPVRWTNLPLTDWGDVNTTAQLHLVRITARTSRKHRPRQ